MMRAKPFQVKISTAITHTGAMEEAEPKTDISVGRPDIFEDSEDDEESELCDPAWIEPQKKLHRIYDSKCTSKEGSSMLGKR